MSISQPPQLPGRIRSARAVSYSVAGIALLMALISLQAGFGDEATLRELETTAGAVITLGVIALTYGAAGVALAYRFVRAESWVRIAGIVWGVGGMLLGFGTGTLGLVVFAASIALVVLLAMKDSRAWFARAKD